MIKLFDGDYAYVENDITDLPSYNVTIQNDYDENRIVPVSGATTHKEALFIARNLNVSKIIDSVTKRKWGIMSI